MKKKRKLVRIRILYLMFFMLLVQTGFAVKPDTVSFLHVSDLHLIFNLDILQKDLANDREHYGYGVSPFDKFLKNVPKKTEADFVVATGDLIDFYEGETKNNEMFGSLIEQFAQLVNQNNIPVYATLGNHDITQYSWSDSSRVTSQNEAGSARATWIRNLSCFYNGTYYSHVYNAGNTDYRLIYLDDSFNQLQGQGNYEVPFIDKAQQNWLKSQFDLSDDDVEIVIMHIPIRQGASDVSENSIYSILSGQPSLKMVLAGHNHRNVIIPFNNENGHFQQVQTAAFASDREAWRLFMLTEDNIIVSAPGQTLQEITIPIH